MSVQSNIDPTVFPDNRVVTKENLREQFEIARDEITKLQQQSTLVRLMMFDDGLFRSL